MTDSISQLKQAAPLVHCITNYVAMNISANVVLAAGGSPAMIHTAEESGDFARIASALTINIGTLSPAWVEGMHGAARAARDAGVPWVLDPVAHFATPYRAQAARELLAQKPNIIRGNASEIMALGGEASQAKGADACDGVAAAKEAAHMLATQHACVVAVTGEVDFITDGTRSVEISGGAPLMPKITALGCSLTCLMGGFAAIEPAFDAAITSCLMFAEAGQRAAQHATGPGSFSPPFLDALYALTDKDLNRAARITWH